MSVTIRYLVGRIATNSEEIRQLTHTKASYVLSCLLVKRFADESTLLLLQLDNPVFHSVGHEDTVYFHRPRLA
jgi:hypothetical protein